MLRKFGNHIYWMDIRARGEAGDAGMCASSLSGLALRRGARVPHGTRRVAWGRPRPYDPRPQSCLSDVIRGVER